MNAWSNEKRRSRDVETAAFQYGAALVFVWLLTGFWQLQVSDPEVYEKRAESNSVKSLPIVAPRGKIFDRDGRILVNNAPAFKVMLTRDAIEIEHLPLISEGLGIPYEELQAFLREIRDSKAPDYRQVILKENLSPAEVAFLEANRSELRELELIRSQQRLYPREGLASHVVGYVSEISEKELQLDEFALYEPGAEVGKAGVERQYNDALTGVDGSRLVVVDSRSRRVRDLDVVDAEPGRNLKLSIDLDLQAVAELGMEGRRGAVVALDPRNGEVLALVSRPNFNPNSFVGGISPEEWTGVVRDPDKPMLNRAIQAQLAPGSIFKPIVALAAISTQTVDPSFQVFCRGGASFYGRFFRCHRAAGHGWVDMEKALMQSCDVYFYTLGKELGIDRIAEFAEAAGLGEPTGVDLPHEEEGVVPSTTWKVRFFRDKWYAGETISVAIGQGALTLTPLQAAYALGGLAAGGVWHQPHLLPYDQIRELEPEFTPPPPHKVEVSRHHLNAIVRGLWGVVNGGGTGVRASIPGYEVCGKTGSAQRVSRKFAAQNPDDERYKDDAWFVGFAPCREPEIVAVVLVENGEHGSWSAPIVRDVIKAYLDKRLRVKWAQQSPPAFGPTPPPALAADVGAVERGR